MRNSLKIIVLLAIFATVSACNVIQDLNSRFSSEATLSTQTLINGLKEALAVGTEISVNRLSTEGGFGADKAIRIITPPELKPVADTLRKIGLDPMVNSFEDKMNRAAESATALATPVFMKAIKEMTFDDAKKILDGSENAATEYFRGKTENELKKLFKPVVRGEMEKVGLIRAYNNLMEKYNTIPLTSKPQFDLENYITNKTLNGLFSAIASEEAKIRHDPAARTSELLKKVFSK